MIVEDIQGNIANLSAEEKQKHVEKYILKTLMRLNVFNVSQQITVMKSVFV